MNKTRVLIKTVLVIVIFCILQIINTVFANNNDKEEIEEGVYIIKSAVNENYVFDIYNNSKQDGANLELWLNNKGENQKFRIKKAQNNCYTITSINSNKNIDVAGNAKKLGTNVLQWEKNNQENQQWIIKKLENGFYNIISKSNNLYLDIPNSDAKAGANVHVWAGNGGKNQMFKFEKINESSAPEEQLTIPTGTKTIEDGIYSIKTALNENYAFDIYNNSIENGANLELWIKRNASNQKFEVKYLDNGFYSISSINSKKLLEVEGNKKKLGTNVSQYKNTGENNQKWIIKNVGKDEYNIISASSGLYIDIPNSEAKAGTNVHVWAGNGGKNQIFKFEKQTIIKSEKKIVSEGIHLIKSATDDNKVFDVAGNSIDNGGNIGLWFNRSSPNQKFNLKYTGDGYYSIEAIHSGKYIDIENSYSKNGANIIQYENNNLDSQQWVIRECEEGYYNIISKIDGLYLTVESDNICLKNNSNSDNQKFKFENPTPIKGGQTISDGNYVISPYLNDNYFWDIPNASKQNGAILEIWQKKYTNNQVFKVKYIEDGYYTITSINSEKNIEVKNGQMKVGTNLQQGNPKQSDEQQWIIKEDGNGYYYIISKYNELYVELCDGKTLNGNILQLSIFEDKDKQKFKFTDLKDFIKLSNGTYGYSGIKIEGDPNGSNLKYYKFGSGTNVLFATFAVHGFEDKWNNDGTELVKIAAGFWNNLKTGNYYDIAYKWTIYLFPEVNPDGRRFGWTNDGPGRTTLYSLDPNHTGIDMNRCWSSDFHAFHNSRNYTGDSPFLAYEARYLRDFLLSHKSKDGQTLLVDLHGWTQQLIGDQDIAGYYGKYFPENSVTPTYGKGYLINWARNNLGSYSKPAKSALIELPDYIKNSQDVINNKLQERYTNATIAMLRNILNN